MSDESIIAKGARELDRLKAAKMTDAQLAANVQTYGGAHEGSTYTRWAETCRAEQAKRAQ
jgi:hypothetical protein